jgi:hypothetical protein
MKIFVESNNFYLEEIKYIFRLFAENKKLDFVFVNDFESADISIGDKERDSIKVSIDFFEKLAKGLFSHSIHFTNSTFIKLSDGRPDYLSSAFYMVNCIQEVNSGELDQFGRFQYENSFQKKFGVITENLVQICFDKFYKEQLEVNKNNVVPNQTRIFLSHDIDTIYGSLMQDGFYAVKKMRPDWIFSIMLKNILEKPSWFNIDEIMKIESDYDFKSTFYWLVNRGRVNEYLSNSDYDIRDKKISSKLTDVVKKGWENGLHKSASDTSFKEEMDKINIEVIGNRYHYVKFRPSDNFIDIERAGLKFDTSLGFAEMYGFRNSYGRPFRPFDLKSKRTLKFVECPLNIMDTTFFNYLKYSADQFVETTINFVEKNNRGNIVSVLFHNNYISAYKYDEYFKAFKKLLAFFHESGFKSINQSEIITEFYHEY